MQTETIKGWPYSISNDGTIRNTKNGNLRKCVVHPKTKRLTITLYKGSRDAATSKGFSVAHLVGHAFVRGYSPALKAIYKDGNPMNCAASNLIFVDKCHPQVTVARRKLTTSRKELGS